MMDINHDYQAISLKNMKMEKSLSIIFYIGNTYISECLKKFEGNI